MQTAIQRDADCVVEHERRLDVVGERRHLLLAEEVLEQREHSDITARFPLPQVRHAAIFPPIFLERQTSSDPYLSIYLSRRVDMGQGEAEWIAGARRSKRHMASEYVLPVTALKEMPRPTPK